ncbi:MAG TPA: serine/threonine-protein kinase [Acidimicrobiales bacterium]|nr:serine/threonine-protein kinase [Acidimicrobiales bacterium]
MAITHGSLPAVIAGRYQLDGELGRGGMAEVQAGTDLRLERPVAVKFLLPEMAARDDIRRRFEAEARNAAALTHPHAVAVYDTGEHDGIPFMVMERLPGETLADRIAGGPVDQAWLRQVAGEVLGALAAAHAVGMVHRDVKPGNILLTADGHAKIADFGIAKSLEASADRPDLTGTGQLLGTPAYLAPERLDGAPATARSDLYSLGVVLYEALAGRCPFAGDTPLAAARAVAAGEYPPLRELRPDVDPALAATVERAMAREPGDRFPSAEAMAASLAAPGAAAGAPTLVDAVVPPPTSVLDVESLAPPPMVKPRGRVPLALLVGLVLVALLVAGLQHRGGKSGTNTVASQSPSSTAAPSPTSSLVNDLRAAAGRLGANDGARAADLAGSLRQVADQVDAGSPAAGATATAAIVTVGAWRLTGQLTDSAASTAVALLSRVPGVTVVTLPAQTGGNAGTVATTAAPAPAAGKGKADDKGTGKGNGKG